MKKLFKKLMVAGCVAMAVLTMGFGFEAYGTKAESSNNDPLNDQDLYNATNTYDVDESNFVDGVFQPVIDSDRIDSTIGGI